MQRLKGNIIIHVRPIISGEMDDLKGTDTGAPRPADRQLLRDEAHPHGHICEKGNKRPHSVSAQVHSSCSECWTPEHPPLGTGKRTKNPAHQSRELLSHEVTTDTQQENTN